MLIDLSPYPQCKLKGKLYRLTLGRTRVVVGGGGGGGGMSFFLEDKTSAPDGFSSAKRLLPFYCPLFHLVCVH